MTLQKFDPPHHASDLKTARLWGLDWAQDTFPDSDFNFYICRKTADGYEIAGYSDELTEAFRYRKELSANGAKYFLRAKRIVATYISADGDDDTALDFFRDKHSEGVGLEDIPRHLRAGYLAYQRGRRSAR